MHRTARPRAPVRSAVTGDRVGGRRPALKLELRGITKRFGSLVANDHIDLTVEPAEIHCLLGENGAGKSTLMNVLYGLLQPDEGEILVDGEQLRIDGPGDAVAAGIGMVHQHFMLVPVFSVADNVMLGGHVVKTGLAPLLESNFGALESNGTIRDKAAVVARTKKAKWTVGDLSDMKVTVHGDSAIVTGTWTGKGTDADGKAVNATERWLDTWIKTGGKWLCVASASAPLK